MPLLIDTNIFLNYPQIIQEENTIVTLTDVLRELDGLKLNSNPDVAFQARRAAVAISHNLDKIQFLDEWENEKMSVDDKLLCAAAASNLTLITNDVYLKVKAIIKGINTHGYGGASDYTGIYKWTVELDENGYNKDLAEMLKTYTAPAQLNLKENQYLIIESTKGENLGLYVIKNGKVEMVRVREIKNKWINKIVPRKGNLEQICLFDLLHNSNVTIIYAGGPMGVGKSYILNNYALQELEKGHIRKIVYIPNNAYVHNAMELGFLPGDTISKTAPMIGPLVDLIGIDEVNRLIEDDELEVIPMAYLRGRNFDDTIIIVNEAQNLDADHVKLLIGRVGERSRVFFDGSLQQIDSEIFKNRNGLKSLLHLPDSPHAELFGMVRLEKIERSKTAQVADYLDELSGN